MQSKSPLKRFDEFKNRDMPLKVRNDEPRQRKNHDLGLEIFELKKELGLLRLDKQGANIDKILTNREKNKP